MTCIVAIEQNGQVYMGGDSAMSTYSIIEQTRDSKVFIREEFLFGCAGSIRMQQILKFGTLPPLQDDSLSDFGYLVTFFMDHIRQQFKDAGYMEIENGVEDGGNFLLGYRGTLYTVESDFNINSSASGMSAIGSGGDIALGSLYSTTGKPKKRIKTALKVSAHLTPYVRKPFVR